MLLKRIWDISQIDPADYVNAPGMEPPPGVTPNFVDPISQENIGKACIYTAVPIMMVFVVLRLYSRASVVRGFGKDDLTTVIAALGSIAYSVLILQMLGNPMGPHQWDVRLSEVMSLQYMTNLTIMTDLYTVLATITKVSVLLLYLRYFKPSALARYMIWIGVVLISLFYATCLVSTLAVCVLRRGERWYSMTWARRCGPVSMRFSEAQAVVGVVSDFYLLAIPLIQVAKLHISKSQKVGLTAIFLTGLVACIFSVLLSVFRFKNVATEDTTWTTVPASAFSVAEICVGIISSCMPVTFPLFKGAFQRLRVKFSSLHETFLYKRRTPEASHEGVHRLRTTPPRHEELPNVSGGKMLTLRLMFKNVFSSSLGKSTLEDDEMKLTNLSEFDPRREGYHAYIQAVTPGR